MGKRDDIFEEEPSQGQNFEDMSQNEITAHCLVLAERHNGKYIQRKVRYENQNKFKCALGHTLILSNEDLVNEKWCEECENLWEDTLVYLRRHKIKVINLLKYSNALKFFNESGNLQIFGA